MSVALVAFAVGGCNRAPTRSAAAFCSTLVSEKQRFLSTYDTKGQDPLRAFATGMGSLGEIPIIFDKLDKVAPADIEPDVAAVRDSFKQQESSLSGAASDPLGAIATGLAAGLTSQGPFTQVQNYVVAHCPAGA